MKIIIAGAGEVGYHLSKQLSNEEHDITVIDVNQSHLDRVDANTDVMTLYGDSTHIRILKDANVQDTDLVVAVTSSESVNVNVCVLSKKLGAKKTIARVSNGDYINPDYQELFTSMGIDHQIYPEDLAAHEVVKLLERSAATDVVEFENGKLIIIGLRLEAKCPQALKKMREVSYQHPDTNFRVVAIQRGMNTLIPSGEDIFVKDDQIFVLTTQDALDRVLDIFGKKSGSIQDIMILGGGKIGRKTARLLEKRMNVKLIESDENKTHDLADYLENTLIIKGDGRDLDLLAQEGIIDMDAFISVTDDAETNIITSLMAKHLQVKKTIALVDNVNYIPLTHTIGIESMINKKLIAASNIIKYIRHEKIITIATLHGSDAEVLEYEAGPNSQITRKPIHQLKFPENTIIGGYIRNEEGFVTLGSSHIQEGDKVIVIALPGSIQKLEKLFK